MFKRKTRCISAVVAVFMLLSLLAGFVLPLSVAAESYYDEVVSSTGLKDVTSLPDIATNYSADVTEYKVTNRAGLEKMAELVNGGTALSNVTITQAADIDLGNEPFFPIGWDIASGTHFAGTYDGNGFVIENLFILEPRLRGVGLFGQVRGGTIKNVGIASGFIYGGDYVGGIVGEGIPVNIYNCWNAATVMGLGTNGIAGIAGRAVVGGSTESVLYNVYNLGTIINNQMYATGLASWVNSSTNIYNSYNMGRIIACLNGTGTLNNQLAGYNVLVRMDSSAAARMKDSANNFYSDSYITNGGSGSYSDAKDTVKGYDVEKIVATDHSTKLKDSDMKDGSAIDQMNEKFVESEVYAAADASGNKYDIAYSHSTAGYPVLTYSQNGEAVVKRTAHADKNVAGDGTMLTTGSFVNQLFSRAFKTTDAMTEVEIATADDLLILALMTGNKSMDDALGLNSATIKLTADIDMDDVTITPFNYSAKALFSTVGNANQYNTTDPFIGTFDGQNHVIRNWRNVVKRTYGMNGANGLIFSLGAGGTVKNVGLVDAWQTEDYFGNSEGNWYQAMLVAMTNTGDTGATIENCFVTGETHYLKAIDNRNNNGAVLGRIMSSDKLTVSNCWADATVYWDNDTQSSKMRVIGSSASSAWTVNKLFYISDVLVQRAESETIQGAAYQGFIPVEDAASVEVAAKLNNAMEQSLWTYNGEYTTFAQEDGSDAGHTVTFRQFMSNGTTVVQENYAYAKPGDTVTIPSYEGYELQKTTVPGGKTDSFTMSDEDVVIEFIATSVDLSVVDEYEALYQKYLDDNLLEDASAVEDVLYDISDIRERVETYEAAGTLNTPSAQNTLRSLIDYMLEDAEIADNSVKLKDFYPYYPVITDYDFYSAFNESNSWAIATDADWRKAVEISQMAANPILSANLHLLNDVEMNTESVSPLGFQYGVFTGLLDGHGYAFKNLHVAATATSATNENSVGLIAGVISGVVQNLGIDKDSDICMTTASNLDIGLGSFAGMSGTSARFYKLWSDAKVTAVGAGCTSAAGIVGRGMSNTVFNGCYHTGTVKNPGTRSAGLNAWAQGNYAVGGSTNHAVHYNGFFFGVIDGRDGGVITYNNPFQDRTENNFTLNIWSTDYNIFTANTQHPGSESFDSKDPTGIFRAYNNAHKLTQASYSNGELAWNLNNEYHAVAGYDRVYYTLSEDGKTVFGDETNMTRRITLEFDSGRDTEYLYVNNGGAVELSGNLSAVLTEGTANVSGQSISNIQSDVTVSVTISGVDTQPVEAALEYFAIRDTKVFANSEELEALIEEIQEKLENGSYTSSEEVVADAAALADFQGKYTDIVENLPKMSDYDLYTDAPGFTLRTAADMEALVRYANNLTTAHTLYVTASELDLTDSTFTGIANLSASIDGLGHTIKGGDSNGKVALIGTYRGSFIKNLTLDGFKTTKGGYGAAILISSLASSATLSNVTLKNCSVSKPESVNGTSNRMGGLIAAVTTASATVNIVDCAILNCQLNLDYLNSSTGKKIAVGNVGFVIGQLNNRVTANVTNLTMIGNSINTAVGGGFGTGILFGAIEGNGADKGKTGSGGHAVVTNVAAFGNHIDLSTESGWQVHGLIAGIVMDGGSWVKVENLLSANNTGSDNTDLWLWNNDAGSRYSYHAEQSAKNVWMDRNRASAFEGGTGGAGINDSTQGPRVGTKENINLSISLDDFKNGKVAYEANQVVGQKWYLPEGAERPVWADSDDVLPVQITVNVVEDDTTTSYFYTDENGKIIDSEGFAALLEEIGDAENDYDGELTADTIFAEDTVITFTLHTHEWTAWEHVEGTNTHKRTCTTCSAEEVVEVELETYSNNDGTHTIACTVELNDADCTYAVVVNCEDHWADPAGVKTEATCLDDAYTTYTCEVCGYEKVETEEESALGHDFDVTPVYDAEAEENVHQHIYTCANCAGELEGGTKTEACVEVENIDLQPTLTSEGHVTYTCQKCGNVREEILPMLKNATVAVSSIKNAAPMDGFELYVDLLNNPGIAGMTVAITFNNKALDCYRIQAGDILNGTTFVEPAPEPEINGDTTTLKFSFASATDVVDGGTLATLSFMVLEDAANGTTDVTVEVSDITDSVGTTVEVETTNGTVHVYGFEKYDVNRDGKVTVQDAILLFRYLAGEVDETAIDLRAADVVGNDGPTVGDATALMQYLLEN